MEKKFTSVEELDAYLETLTPADIDGDENIEKDATIETEVELETVTEEEVVEDEAEESEDEEALADGEDEEEVVDEPKVKETKEEKQERQRNYSMSKLRKDAHEAKVKAEKAEQEAETLRVLTTRLMKTGGFNDLEEFKNAVEQQLSEKEMKEKGLTKEQYTEIEVLRKQNQDLTARLSRTESVTNATKAKNFNDLVNTYADKAKVTSKEVYDSLQSKGYTVENLLAQPDPEILIKGILADKLTVVKTVVKKQVDTQKLTSGGNAKPSQVTIEDLVKQDLEEYKARKGNS